MRAGLLREFLTFQKLTKTQSATTGAEKQTWTDVCTFRAWKKKLISGETFDSKEMFTSERLTFQLRYDSRITSDMKVIYNGTTYKMVGVPDRQIEDNTLIIQITKVNE